jgi:hypothetical protein
MNDRLPEISFDILTPEEIEKKSNECCFCGTKENLIKLMMFYKGCPECLERIRNLFIEIDNEMWSDDFSQINRIMERKNNER